MGASLIARRGHKRLQENMAWSDMRAVTVTGATLAFVGCCLFVMHSENASLKFESVKLWEETTAAEQLPKSLAEAAAKVGQRAKAPKVEADQVVEEKTDKHNANRHKEYT